MRLLDLFVGEDAALMALREVGSTPTRSASACRGLGIHGLVATSDVAKRDPFGHIAQWQSDELMGSLVAGSIPAVLSMKMLTGSVGRSPPMFAS